jgi:hypothetical protein
MPNTYIHREAWLDELAMRLEPIFADQGFPIPKNRRVTCGFPSRLATSKRIGECWASTASKDGTFELMISPRLAEPMFVASVLAHELVHAAVGLECGHKGPFKRLALGIGLVGKMTSTLPGDLFIEHAGPIIEDLGPYPHAALDTTAKSSGPPKQVGRNIKASCPECGYTVRTTRYWLDSDAGAPICPADHVQMVEG